MRQNWIATDPGKYPSFGRDFKGFVLYRNSPGELVINVHSRCIKELINYSLTRSSRADDFVHGQQNRHLGRAL